MKLKGFSFPELKLTHANVGLVSPWLPPSSPATPPPRPVVQPRRPARSSHGGTGPPGPVAVLTHLAQESRT